MSEPGKITIGEYEISYSRNNFPSDKTVAKYWICHKSGEGTEVDGYKLEKLIHDFFEENM